jgi:hypothetical protein
MTSLSKSPPSPLMEDMMTSLSESPPSPLREDMMTSLSESLPNPLGFHPGNSSVVTPISGIFLIDCLVVQTTGT